MTRSHSRQDLLRSALRQPMLSAGVLLSLAPSAFATIGVTNGTFGTSNTNCLTVHNGGWLESTVTTNWVEGSWSNGNATAFPTGMVCLFDGTAANGYIYQSLGTLTAGEIAQGLLRVTCDFSEKSDDTTVNGTFDVFAGTMASPAHGTDIAAAGLTNIFNRTMTAVDQGLTASSGNNSRQTKVVGTIDISSLTPGTELWIRVSRPSSGSGDFIIDNLTTAILTAPLNWDINGSTAGAGGATPTGVWDGAIANWSASPDGASAPTAWTEGKPAAFAAGSDATGSYTVTVSGIRTTESLACEEGTVLLTGGEIGLTSPAGISAASGSQLRIESILSGSSGISTSGTGTTILAGANGYSGSTSLAGTVRLDGGAAIPDGSPVVGMAGASVTLLSDETIGDLTGSGGIALGGNTLRVGTATASTSFGGAFTGAGTWIKQGTGILVLTGQSSFTGAVVVSEGTISAQGPAADGAFPNAASVTIQSGGTVASGSNGLFGYNNHPVPVTVNAGGTLTVNGGANGGPNLFGILTVAGGNVAEDNSVHGTYGSYNFGGASIIATGTTTSTLSARDFQLRNSATTVQVDAGSTLNVTGYFTGLAHAAGKTLNKTGTGKLILASETASSHGATNVNEGTLELAGAHGNGKITVAAGATLAGTGTTGGVVEVQANGLLTTADSLIENLTLNSSVTLAGITALEITKDGGTPANDQIFVMSGVTYGGTLTVSNITADASILSVGDSFKLFDASTYGGGFTTFDLPVLPAGLSWDRSGLTTTGTITVINNVSSPVFTPPGGGYAGAQSVTISSDSGSTIYYTLDGSTPGPTSLNGPSPLSGINVPTNSSMTVKAYAVKAGQGNSSVATAQYTTVTTPTWTEAFGGNWSNTDTFNWLSGVVANGADVTADFSTLTLDADASVFLTDARTIGHLRFGDVGNTYGWTLSGSELALLAGPSPSITVNNQRTIISAPLAGTTGMRKEGAGILQLAANEDYTGNTVVNGGTLELAAGGAAYTNSTLQGTLTVNGGATCSLVSATALGWGGGLTDIHLNGGELSGAGAMAFGVSYHLTGGTINATGSIRMGVLTGFPNVTLNSAASPTTSVINAGGLTLATTFGQDSLAVTVAQGTTPSGIDLQINAPISGGYSLVKAGAGNLQLAGANTYGGATTVNEGTLTITGSVTSGTTVTGTAKLAGTGNTIGGATIGATAFVAPAGDSAGELLSGAASVDGTYQCQLDGAANDRLTVTGNLSFGAASTIACSTLAGGATESSYVIASFTGTLTGTPQVTGMPAGYALDLTTPNQIRLVKASGYSDWATQWAGGQGIDQDFDGDGVANGIEYFMGQTTSGFTAGPSLNGNVVSWSKGASYTGTYGVDYWIETSASLGIGSWTAVPANDPNLGNGSPLQYTHPAAQSKVFSRLVVTGP